MQDFHHTFLLYKKDSGFHEYLKRDINSVGRFKAKTISENSILKAFRPDLVIINGMVCKNILVGIIDSVDIDGASVILNNNIKEIL